MNCPSCGRPQIPPCPKCAGGVVRIVRTKRAGGYRRFECKGCGHRFSEGALKRGRRPAEARVACAGGVG